MWRLFACGGFSCFHNNIAFYLVWSVYVCVVSVYMQGQCVYSCGQCVYVWLTYGKPTQRAVTTMGSNDLVVGEVHMLGPSCQRYNWLTGR